MLRFGRSWRACRPRRSTASSPSRASRRRLLAPRPHSEPAPATPDRARLDALLSATPLGRDSVRDRQRAEREAAARQPAPISARVRAALATEPLGRQVLAERARRDPDGEARARGIDPARRRELLQMTGWGRVILRDEERGR